MAQTIDQDDARKLLQELKLHQVELAQQNEELRTARSELDASLRRHVDLYQAAPVGLVTVDSRGTVLEINHRGLDLLRDCAAGRVGASLLDCVTAASRGALWHAIAAARPSAERWPDRPLETSGVELEIAQSPGARRSLHAELCVNPIGDGSVLIALTEVTARRRAEAELAHTRNILELSNRIARVGYWELGPDGRRLLWSAVTREIHEVAPGYAPDVESALDFYQPGDDRHRMRAAMTAAQQAGQSFDLELQLSTARGNRLWVRMIGLCEAGEGRCQRRLYGTIQDIDVRVQAEAARLTRAQAEAASRSKSDFLARMSHDLRTPLNAVLGFSRLLALDEAVSASDNARAQVAHIHGAGEHLLAMIDDMLDLTRIEAGGLRLSIESIAAVPLVGECVALTAALADARRVAVRVRPGANGAWLLADRTRLRQVLINLLTNAVKYNVEGGSVEIGLVAEGEHLAISVRDTGLGMTPEQLTGLFQSFNRLGAEHSAVEGLGLGLAISRQLVVAMGGAINVESMPGQGSVFTVRLPRAAEPVASDVVGPYLVVSTAVPPRAASTRPFVLLYIEDNPVNQALMRFVVAEREGVTLELAADGVAGLEAVRALRPDLVLLDLGLPRLDGYGVLARLREDPALAAIPCVAVSANAMAVEVQRALDAGFTAYVTKPFEIDRILELIDRLRG